jgi:MraZ protein
MGFKGHDLTSVDGKRRVVIASSLRRAMHESARDTFSVTLGLDDCIYAYPLNEWERLEQQLLSLSLGDPSARHVQRLMLHNAKDCSLDQQGRILLPQSLADKVRITPESGAIVKGMIDHLEIWNPATYEKYEDGLDQSYESAALSAFTSLVRERS